jgi:hypothetical protein
VSDCSGLNRRPKRTVFQPFSKRGVECEQVVVSTDMDFGVLYGVRAGGFGCLGG